ncbi:MAG: 16S rRNA (cytosine(1402)-N(4))-methyltransferase RsmH [bacterium]|nr:16S rRNA (cytosine(1402)-N(4))-methyltransferase RsmH [bacterium]
MKHEPVLLNEVIKLLDPKKGEFFIDGTFGSGGHSAAILEKIGPEGELLAVDWDANNIEKGKKELPSKNVIWANNSYSRLPEILRNRKLPKADGLLLDLGFSSEQLGGSGRGFSFLRDEPLLMTYAEDSAPVSEILATIREQDLAEIIKTLGEERYAQSISRAIVARRKKKPIATSGDLAQIIRDSVPGNYERGRRWSGASRIDPATRTFQALRIYANRELENLEAVLQNLTQIVRSGGRVAIISFHSLEDRLVKNHFRNLAKEGGAEILTKKPITASSGELRQNPRSRSAKLRLIKIQ